MFEFVKKRFFSPEKEETIVLPPTRREFQEQKQELWSRVEKEHRAQQIGKEGQIIPDQSKLVPHEPITDEKIQDELGIPPKIHIHLDKIVVKRLFDGTERPRELQEIEKAMLSGIENVVDQGY